MPVRFGTWPGVWRPVEEFVISIQPSLRAYDFRWVALIMLSSHRCKCLDYYCLSLIPLANSACV